MTDSESFKFKVIKMLKSSSRTLEMLLISLFLTSRTDCVISVVTGAKMFEVTNIKLYVSVVILSNQNTAKL